MEVTALVLFHEIIGFAVPGKMNAMPLLLKVMAEVQGTGSMPQPLSADNKKNLHVSFCSKHMSLINDELLPGST
jgi:hypothetical protein